MNDPFVGCPYDPAHRVPRSRIQSHIIKCQIKHPALATCPYNASHRLPESQLKQHVDNCPTRIAVFPEKVVAKLTTPRPIIQRDYLPETDPNHDIWDD